jgi:hypothetical protein
VQFSQRHLAFKILNCRLFAANSNHHLTNWSDFDQKKSCLLLILITTLLIGLTLIWRSVPWTREGALTNKQLFFWSKSDQLVRWWLELAANRRQFNILKAKWRWENCTKNWVTKHFWKQSSRSTSIDGFFQEAKFLF